MKLFAMLLAASAVIAGDAVAQISADPMGIYGGYRERPAFYYAPGFDTPWYGVPYPYYGSQYSPRIYSYRGQYLGRLNSDPYDAESIANPYSRYGSPYSPDSVNNPYGAGAAVGPFRPYPARASQRP